MVLLTVYGIASKCSVCPVGAVSMMTRSNEASYTPCKIYVNTANSSNPGSELAASLKIDCKEVNNDFAPACFFPSFAFTSPLSLFLNVAYTLDGSSNDTSS
uniref:Uncharacterized protein n=1 Tax=Lygus hesperus TaxID=30085 RepID=A0A146LZP8_LYGHE